MFYTDKVSFQVHNGGTQTTEKFCYRSLSMHKVVPQLCIKVAGLIENGETCLSYDHC